MAHLAFAEMTPMGCLNRDGPAPNNVRPKETGSIESSGVSTMAKRSLIESSVRSSFSFLLTNSEARQRREGLRRVYGPELEARCRLGSPPDNSDRRPAVRYVAPR